MNYPKVSVIILNWNGLKYTIECLESLKKITYPNYEVILVDNGSKGNEADILEKKYKDYIKLIRNKENLGFAEGNNVAIREVIKEGKSDYILLLNNDIIVEPDFLDELVKYAKRHPEVGSIQPKMIWTVYPQLIDSVGLEYSRNGNGFSKGIYEPIEKYNQEKEIFGCCAAACLYRREALEDIKINDEYFDKDFFALGEDLDIAFRLQWASWKAWYCPKAIVYHFRGKAIGTRNKFGCYYGPRNQTWNLFKNLPNSFILKNLHWIILEQLGQIGIYLLQGRFFLLKSILKGRLDGYLGLRRILKKRKRIKKTVNFSEIEKWFILKWRVKIPQEIQLIVYAKNFSNNSERSLFLKLSEKYLAEANKYHEGFFENKISAKTIRLVLGLYRHGPKYGKYILARLGLLKQKDVEARLFWGKKIIVPLQDNDAAVLFYSGAIIGLEYRLFRFFIKNLKENDVFYDVGANYGFYTFLADEFITKGEVHAFEPQEDVFVYLEKNTKSLKNCFINKIALSNTIEKLYLYVAQNYSGSNTIVSDIASAQFIEMKKSEISATTLDEYVKDHKKPTVIKIDVEGAEPQVLKGGIGTLSKESPIIAMEIWREGKGRELSEQALSVLDGLGYKAYKIKDSGDIKLLSKKPTESIEKGFGLENFIFMK